MSLIALAAEHLRAISQKMRKKSAKFEEPFQFRRAKELARDENYNAITSNKLLT